MRKICAVLLILFLGLGCSDDEEPVWEKIATAKVVKIEIEGVGGYGSPNAMRVWTLDNGMVVAMNHWKNEDVGIGDVVAKYERASGKWPGYTVWQKESESKP